MLVLQKGKKRPIGFVTPGGYIKTVKGWRKVTKKKEAVEKKKLILEKEKKEITQQVAVLELSDIQKMSTVELRSYVTKNFNARLTRVTKTNRKAADAVVYQLGLLKGAGFINRTKLKIRFDDRALEAKNARGDYTFGKHLLRVSSKYKESFIHEYFHHLFYTRGLRKTKKVQQLVGKMRYTESFNHFVELDKMRESVGKKSYYTKDTEMLSRLASQIVPNMFALKWRKGFMYTSFFYEEDHFLDKDLEKLRKLFVDAFTKGKAIKELLKSIVFKSYDKNQIKIGIKIEKEHTDDRRIAEKIAKDHLKEDPKYYDKLLIMEGKGKYSVIEKKVLQWFKKYPNPSDRQVHDFAEQLKIEPDDLEEIIYKLTSEHAKMVAKSLVFRKAVSKQAMQHKDVLGAGAKKRKKLSAKDKFDTVMAEFERGTLHSSDGKIVTNREQAVAIAYSESGLKKSLILFKSKKRPIGFVTPGGYVKTSKGWRKVKKLQSKMKQAKKEKETAVTKEIVRLNSIMKKRHGTTKNPEETGFILTDAVGVIRREPTRHESLVRDNYRKDLFGWGMKSRHGFDSSILDRYLETSGAIRVDYSDPYVDIIDIRKEPTEEQIYRLVEIARSRPKAQTQIQIEYAGKDLFYEINHLTLAKLRRALQGKFDQAMQKSLVIERVQKAQCKLLFVRGV